MSTGIWILYFSRLYKSLILSILFRLTVSLTKQSFLGSKSHIAARLIVLPWHVISFHAWLVMPEEEGTNFLQSVGTSVPHYTTLYPKDRKFPSRLIFIRLTCTFMAKHGLSPLKVCSSLVLPDVEDWSVKEMRTAISRRLNIHITMLTTMKLCYSWNKVNENFLIVWE